MNSRSFVSGLCLLALFASTQSRAAVETTSLADDRYLVRFRFTAPANATSVHLAGTFNGWDPKAQLMQRDQESGVFRCALQLPAGRHEYKFVVNGSTWLTDPDNPDKTGGFQNSVLQLGMTASTPTADAIHRPAVRYDEAAHPAVLRAWADRLSTASPGEVSDLASRLFRDHPMPLITGDTVSFVWLGNANARAAVRILADGASMDYRLAPLGGGASALTLERSRFPDRWAYLYVVQDNGTERTMLDPHAWSVTSRADRPVSRGVAASEKVGRIELLPSIQPESPALQPRDIYVYLPPEYDRNNARYPVLYMHDGQNCWDDPINPFGHGGWSVNLTADRLITDGKAQPFIVVAIANTADRLREYGPNENILAFDGHPYIEFVKRQVKPFVDAHYRTNPEPGYTAIAGSSMGGAISLQAALLNPGFFGGAACLSPALMFKDASDRGYLDLLRATGKCDVRLYIDNGTAGPTADGREATHELVAALRAAGWTEDFELMYYEDSGAAHNETAWRARLERPLMFLFPRD